MCEKEIKLKETASVAAVVSVAATVISPDLDKFVDVKTYYITPACLCE